MLVLRRRVRTVVHRLRTFIIETRWVVISLTLAAVGVVSAFVRLPAWISICLAVGSVSLVIVEIRNHRQLSKKTEFSPRPGDDFRDVRIALRDSQRFSVFDFPNGTFIFDRLFSAAVGLGSIPAHLHNVDYLIPGEIRSAGRQFLRRRLREKRHAYNDPVLGLHTDLGTGDLPTLSPLEMIAATYWDHVSSDLFAMFDVTVDGRYEPAYGRNLFVHRSGMPRDFADSWLLNAVGASVLAFTSDARLVVVSQSAENDSSPDLFAPSGSGSIEPKDFRGASELGFDALAINSAQRELGEEAGVIESDIVASFFLGFGRWLDKAAKPEVFTVAFLSIDSHEVRRRKIPKADRPFTQRVEARRFATPPSSWASANAPAMVDDELRPKLSVPLAAGLALLAVHVEGSDSPLGAATLELFGRSSRP